MTETILQNRDREILKAVIDSYLLTGEPVGSRTISREHPEALSPATIRNVMSDLEEVGLLAQPHPSAGRVPTERGLRLYVDELIHTESLPPEERDRIFEELVGKGREVGALLEQASHILAEVSHSVGVVLLPELSHRTIESVNFVRVGVRRISALIVSRPGMVDHRVVEADEDYPQEELDKVSRYLSETFRGLTLEQIRTRLIGMMSEEKSLYDRLMREALELSARSFDVGGARDELIVDGTANILDHREFGDVEKMKALFHAFEEKSRLVCLLNRCLEADGSRLFFGSETGTGGIEGVTLIASPYREGGRPLGTLGIVGPTRMQYARAIALVETLARLLSEVLGEGGGQARARAMAGGRDLR